MKLLRLFSDTGSPRFDNQMTFHPTQRWPLRLTMHVVMVSDNSGTACGIKAHERSYQ
jgi:hypothetical protein